MYVQSKWLATVKVSKYNFSLQNKVGKNKWTGKQNQCWSYLWCWTWSSCWKIEDIHVVDWNNILFDLKPYLTSLWATLSYIFIVWICRFSWNGIVFIELIFRDSCTNSYFTSFIINQFCNFTLCTMYCVSLVYVIIIINHHWAFKKTKVWIVIRISIYWYSKM